MRKVAITSSFSSQKVVLLSEVINTREELL
jgi:hypothetical protein